MNRGVFYFGIISAISALVGVICYFINPVITIVCGVVSLINSVIQIAFGDQNNFGTEFFSIIVAVIISLIFDLPIFTFIGFILCVVEVIMAFLGWVMMYKMFRR